MYYLWLPKMEINVCVFIYIYIYIYIYILCIYTYIHARNWYIYWDANISHSVPQITPCPMYREILTVTVGFFTRSYTIINISSTQLLFYHTYTNTHITEGSILIFDRAFVSQTRSLAISKIWNI